MDYKYYYSNLKENITCDDKIQDTIFQKSENTFSYFYILWYILYFEIIFLHKYKNIFHECLVVFKKKIA